MAVEFSNETMETALKCALIIAQQQEMMDEAVTELADNFSVSKSIAKKIVNAYAKDTLTKTSEKMENERDALVNADVMLECVENLSFDPEDINTDLDTTEV